MYRCGYCGTCSEPGQVRLLHTEYRMVPKSTATLDRHGQVVRLSDGRAQQHYFPGEYRKEIAKETPVCRRCKSMLDNGMTVAHLQTFLEAEYQQHLAKQARRAAHAAPNGESNRKKKRWKARHWSVK